ncbi:MAG: hypothetical protein HOH80_20495, partial [Rhodospirillaceae bacterium]|nr:hypothetical protein [Rhodospirillaceae bacterium]
PIRTSHNSRIILIKKNSDTSGTNSAETTPTKTAATIAAALFYLRREAAATGFDSLASIIDLAVKEASELAHPDGADIAN